MTPDETKAVLAMPKWEQAEFLFQYTNQKPYKERSKSHWLALANAINCHNDKDEDADDLLDAAFSLLAVRLWDEAKHITVMAPIMIKVQQEAEVYADVKADYVFWAMRARPIHKILVGVLAALLAKENEDGE